jgi:hypothetical protein
MHGFNLPILAVIAAKQGRGRPAIPESRERAHVTGAAIAGKCRSNPSVEPQKSDSSGTRFRAGIGRNQPHPAELALVEVKLEYEFSGTQGKKGNKEVIRLGRNNCRPIGEDFNGT